MKHDFAGLRLETGLYKTTLARMGAMQNRRGELVNKFDAKHWTNTMPHGFLSLVTNSLWHVCNQVQDL